MGVDVSYWVITGFFKTTPSPPFQKKVCIRVPAWGHAQLCVRARVCVQSLDVGMFLSPWFQCVSV